jgi:hypothetical protein
VLISTFTAQGEEDWLETVSGGSEIPLQAMLFTKNKDR